MAGYGGGDGASMGKARDTQETLGYHQIAIVLTCTALFGLQEART